MATLENVCWKLDDAMHGSEDGQVDDAKAWMIQGQQKGDEDQQRRPSMKVVETISNGSRRKDI